MIISEAISKIIDRSRYLSEAISKGIINISALSLYIKPELEEMLGRKISRPAIIMALHRVAKDIKPKYSSKNIFTSRPDMTVRSNLFEITVLNSETSTERFLELLKLRREIKYFFTITEGVFETTIIASTDLKSKVKEILKGETIVFELDNLSSITIRLPKDAIKTPGTFYFFLKSLAWEGVNIIEVVSTYLEFSIIFEEKDVNRAFTILRSLFEPIK